MFAKGLNNPNTDSLDMDANLATNVEKYEQEIVKSIRKRLGLRTDDEIVLDIDDTEEELKWFREGPRGGL